MRLYFAGPLFTQAERDWNRLVAIGLRSLGHDVFLPQDAVKELSTLEADPIFRLDVNGVRSADAVVAVLDGADPDSGTSFECGLAFALGIPIVAVRSDFRAGGDALPGQKLATINLMLSQAATAIVDHPNPEATLDQIVFEIGNALAKLPASLEPITRWREST